MFFECNLCLFNVSEFAYNLFLQTIKFCRIFKISNTIKQSINTNHCWNMTINWSILLFLVFANKWGGGAGGSFHPSLFSLFQSLLSFYSNCLFSPSFLPPLALLLSLIPFYPVLPLTYTYIYHSCHQHTPGDSHTYIHPVSHCTPRGSDMDFVSCIHFLWLHSSFLKYNRHRCYFFVLA